MGEVSTGLLVALMYVTILSMGIGSVLTALAHVLRSAPGTGLDRVHVAWVALLLIAHLNLFWHTLDLLSVESWAFFGFLYVIAGPTLLFFATDVMVAPRQEATDGGAKAHYFTVSRRFFLLFILVQMWVIGADLVLGRGFTPAAWFNAFAGGICAALLASNSYRFHATAIGAAWLSYLIAIALRGLSIIV